MQGPSLPSKVCTLASQSFVFSRFHSVLPQHPKSVSDCLLPHPTGVLFPGSTVLSVTLSLNNERGHLKHKSLLFRGIGSVGLGWGLRVCISAGLGWGLRICISEKSSGDADTAGLGTTL